MRRLSAAVIMLVGAGTVGWRAQAADEPPASDAPAAAAPADAGGPAGLAVREVKVEPDGEGRRLVVTLTRAPDALKHFMLPGPPRLVIDLTGPQSPATVQPARFPVDDDFVARVRVARNEGKLRLVADLSRALRAPEVKQEGDRLVAQLAIDPNPTPPANEKPAPAKAKKKPAADAPRVDTAEAPPSPADEPQRLASEPAAPAAAPTPPPAPAPEAAQPPPPPVQREAPVTPPHRETAVIPPHRSKAETAGVGQLAQAEAPAPVEAAPPPPPPAEPPPPRPAPPPARPRVRETAASPSVPARGFRGQRISLDFKDADIQNVLRVLADVSGLNIIATDDVKGKVTLHLQDVPWDQALDLVLRSNRLEATRGGNVVRISTVARLKEEREALRAAQDAERELEPLRVRYVKVNYARADESLTDKVKGVLTDRGGVTFDERTNTIIVRDISHGVEDALDLIRELDTQSPQVLIEANIVEASEDFARALGVQWGYQYTAGPQTGNPTGMNFPGTVGLGGSGIGAGTPPPAAAPGVVRAPVPFLADFPVPSGFGSGFGANNGSAIDLALGSLDGVHSLSTRLTALEEQGKAKLISRPRVITMNNVAATIQSLTILRVKLPSTGTVINTGVGGAAGSASAATEKINTGITLVVTPQISQDGYVLMSIFAKSSQPDFSKTVDGIPNEISREANSNVLIRNGETVVLGGIFRNSTNNSESGLPYLRNIPVLGWLFKRMLRNDHREELLVFLTPKVLTDGTGPLPTAGQLWEERRPGG